MIDSHRVVQDVAKQVLNEIKDYIFPESTEKSISEKCIELLRKNKLIETWYYNAPAFVLLGSRSCLSISGKNYIPNEEKVGLLNLVTIDLSPLLGEVWGDCARSFIIEEGKVTYSPQNKELSEGMRTEQELHEYFQRIVKYDSTFEEIFEKINLKISEMGYVNLDFLGNVGHSIVINRNDRIYFEKGNTSKVGSVECFTFEPHIKKESGIWGFKHEEIYYFNPENNELTVL